jgi:membrane protease YdiL (CAAX protease family)
MTNGEKGDEISDNTDVELQSSAAQRSPVRTVVCATASCILLFAGANLTTALVVRNLRFPIPPSFVTHTILLICSLGLAAQLSRGNLPSFGFTKGQFRFRPRLLLWALPTAAIATIQSVASHSPSAPQQFGLRSPLAVVLLIWIYASVCEEVFMCGLYQSWLSVLAEYKIRVCRQTHLGVPVLLSALLFGGMHAILWPQIGSQALPIMLFALILGIVAGHYREKTKSLAPAILIHALFNIGGSLPTWILSLFFKP